MREPVVFPEGFLDPKLPKGVLSHSQYTTYKNCPSAYEREYVKGVKRPMGARPYKGVAIHGGAEYALRQLMENGGPPPLEEVKEKVSTIFDRDAHTVQSWEPDEPQGRAKDLSIAAYVEWHREVLIKRKVHPVSVEELFLKRIGTVPVMGYIDLVEYVQGPPRGSIPDPGKMVITDLKTSSKAWSQIDIDRDTQFSLYALARSIRNVRVDSITFLKAGPTYSFKESTRDELALRVLIEDYEETADLIKRGIFPKTQIGAWNCSEAWCAHWKQCRGNTTFYLPVLKP